jgi:hypothetical protein
VVAALKKEVDELSIMLACTQGDKASAEAELQEVTEKYRSLCAAIPRLFKRVQVQPSQLYNTNVRTHNDFFDVALLSLSFPSNLTIDPRV